MGITTLLRDYGLPVGLTALFLLLLLTLLAILSRRGIAPRPWRAIISHPVVTGLLVVGLLFLIAFFAYLARQDALERFRVREAVDLTSATNVIANPLFVSEDIGTLQSNSWVVSGTVTSSGASSYPGKSIILSAQTTMTSSVMAVQSGSLYRYSVYTYQQDSGYGRGEAQIRYLWLDAALNVLSWDDTPIWRVSELRDEPAFRTGGFVAPDGAAWLKIELKNTRHNAKAPHDGRIWVSAPKITQQGVYVERHPNGAQGSIAFSFDWESAMGGAIHSKGMEQHDPRAAEQHGMEMRQGADWLNDLFTRHDIKATFYGTGYNLLDGNTERRTFAGDPIYKWASPRNRWASDYWLTHKWYGDDPYGTYQTHPAWYFGDQTRKLLKAGHEIAPHTFGHLYVRGAKPQELAADMDEWLTTAKEIGVPPPTTFAFPWRSSNSLTPDFYDVLYQRGIRAVTRIYERDMKDLYTVAAVPTYTNMLIMPDFLLGAPSSEMDEEAAGSVIGAEKGLQVIDETLARRGTTSFWTHPEQLAPRPALKSVRDAWEKVVSQAAHERDRGRLWIAPVADIVAYQRDVMSVTTSLEQGFLGIGGWKVQVRNDSGKELSGVTLTLPGDVARASSKDTEVLTVSRPEPNVVRLSASGQPVYPARQLVLSSLKPGVTSIEVEWAAGQEPLP